MRQVLVDRELLLQLFRCWDAGLEVDNELEELRIAAAQPAEAEGAIQCPASQPAECYAAGTQVVHASLVHGIVRKADELQAALSAVTAERDARDWEMKAQGVESVINLVVSKHDQEVLRRYADDKRAEGRRVAPGPVDLAADDRQLRHDFESRWPVPKGVTWGAGIGDYCVSEFASGIALSYPDMWMAYKAGAARAEV